MRSFKAGQIKGGYFIVYLPDSATSVRSPGFHHTWLRSSKATDITIEGFGSWVTAVCNIVCNIRLVVHRFDISETIKISYFNPLTNPLSPHDALKHHSTPLKTYLFFHS